MSSGSSPAMKPLVPTLTPSRGILMPKVCLATCRKVPSPPKEIMSSASSAARRSGTMFESPGTSTNTGETTVSRPSSSSSSFARLVRTRPLSR